MDLVFFWASKIIWLLIAPDSLLVIVIIICYALLLSREFKKAKILLGAVALFMITISFLPVGEWLLYPLETRFSANPELPQKIDGVIVLSGGERPFRSALWKQVELNEAAERNFAFIHFVRKYPNAKHVFTGGSGSLTRQQYKSSNVARKLFKEQGLDISQIIFEELSRNTYENAKFTKTLVKPKSDES